uniref:Uncharacterized protein n=1 Tax=Papilio xuthus TaxID=66420 RepID=I4DLR5_PAPXU|nr:unknown unsecreted protein [Papilio xuthus]
MLLKSIRMRSFAQGFACLKKQYCIWTPSMNHHHHRKTRNTVEWLFGVLKRRCIQVGMGLNKNVPAGVISCAVWHFYRTIHC